ncbi:hypothetical protein ACFV2Z_31770 [Streptomyces sp. NPDC059688]|uniref:hypothetical protein n=1 Tax=Streptomyces sp. NPDC059688 TaxID=3346906 RepID=UPI0036BF51A9
MTTTIMTRPMGPAAAPEYFCGACQDWHVGACPAARPDDFARVLAAINSHRTPRPARRSHGTKPGAALGAHLLAVVRAQDAAIPAHRRAPRTLAEMRARLAALYEDEQDACGLCGNWKCTCGQARAHASVTTCSESGTEAA